MINKSQPLIVVFLLLIFSQFVLFSEEYKPMVSILAFTSEAGVSKSDAAALTRIFESSLIKSNTYNVIEKTEADKVLSAQRDTLSGCVDESCAIEIGKMLAAEYIFLGTVSKLGSKFILTIKLIDIQLAKAVDADEIFANTVEGFSDRMTFLVGHFTGESRGSMGKVITESSSGAPISGNSSESEVDKPVYVVFKSIPERISYSLYNIRGELLKEGVTPDSIKLVSANYIVKASYPLYHPFEQDITVVSGIGRITYNLELAPNFGSIKIDSSPSGAEVYQDGALLGNTPYTNNQLLSRDYSYMIKKDLYETAMLTVKIEDGKRTVINRNLESRYINFSVKETNGLKARLYIDGEEIGKLPFSGKLPYGQFDFRIVPEDNRYTPYSESVSVRSNRENINRSIALDGKYGTVSVETDPFMEGAVLIDGKVAGISPDIFNLLAGTHTVRVTGMVDGKQVAAEKVVTVREGKDTELVLSLKNSEYQSIVDRHNLVPKDGYAYVAIDGLNSEHVNINSSIFSNTKTSWKPVKAGFAVVDIANTSFGYNFENRGMYNISYYPVLSLQTESNGPYSIEGWQSFPPKPNLFPEIMLKTTFAINKYGYDLNEPQAWIGIIIGASIGYFIANGYNSAGETKEGMEVPALLTMSALGAAFGHGLNFLIPQKKEIKLPSETNINKNTVLISTWKTKIKEISTSNNILLQNVNNQIRLNNANRPRIEIKDVASGELFLVKPGDIADNSDSRQWQDSVNRAKAVYNKDDYETSRNEYEKALSNGCQDGIAWYRYAYSREQLDGLSADVKAVYSAAYKLLNDQYPDHMYTKSALGKI